MITHRKGTANYSKTEDLKYLKKKSKDVLNKGDIVKRRIDSGGKHVDEDKLYEEINANRDGTLTVINPDFLRGGENRLIKESVYKEEIDFEEIFQQVYKMCVKGEEIINSSPNQELIYYDIYDSMGDQPTLKKAEAHEDGTLKSHI